MSALAVGRRAVLHNGLGRYAEALAAAATGVDDAPGPSSRPGAARADRGGRPEREAGLADDALRAALRHRDRGDSDWALGLEARVRALLSEGARRRALLPRGDRTPGPHPAAARARPRPAAVRRVAAPREPPRRRPRAAAHRPRHLRRDRRRGVRRAGPAGAARHRREGPQAPVETLATSSRRRRSTSPGSPATDAPTPRSAPSSSSARARSNGTCARSSRSSASPHARASRTRCRAVNEAGRLRRTRT